MAAAYTDLFRKKESNFSTTLSASITDADTTIPLSSATGLPTDTAITLTIDRVDANGVSTPTKVERVTGVVSGNNLTDCLRGEDDTTAQAHDSAAVVEDIWDGETWNDAMDALLVEHAQDGTHKVISFSAPEGFLINGRIVPSVASNNLTVALKGLDGNDPSATNPVYVRIGGVIRSITYALSITLAAGTNWFNAGSAELATKEIDFFVYLGYATASSNVQMAVARMPYFRVRGVGTSEGTTSERYYARSGNWTAGDNMVVIGRFAATLSAGAGYTWSVPTFTNVNLIQRPIYETRTLVYVPVPAGFSTNPATIEGSYKVLNELVRVDIYTDADGTSNATTYTMTAPFATLSARAIQMEGSQGRDNGAGVANAPFVRLNLTSAVIAIYKDHAATAWTNSGGKRVVFIGGSYSLP